MRWKQGLKKTCTATVEYKVAERDPCATAFSNRPGEAVIAIRFTNSRSIKQFGRVKVKMQNKSFRLIMIQLFVA